MVEFLLLIERGERGELGKGMRGKWEEGKGTEEQGMFF